MSPDPCSMMTYSASSPTLSSHELLDDTEDPLSDRQAFSSAIMCRPIQAHAFAVSTGMLGPNRTNSLRTIGSFFKGKKKSSPHGPYLPGTFHCVEVVRRCTLSQSIQKRPQDLFPVASDLTPPCRWSLLPCLPKASSQLKN